MLPKTLACFREVWAVDTEFTAYPGERPDLHCLVAHELRSGRTLRFWRNELGAAPPYDIGENSLFVAFFSSADLGVHLALNWQLPVRILDLFAEFRCLTNGLELPAGRGLIGALTAYGLDHIGAAEKEEKRGIAMRGGPYSEHERAELISYCEGDVTALVRLLHAMAPKIDLPRALLRGRYMAAVARMEAAGVPIDVPALDRLLRYWTDIQDEIIADIDRGYGVYDGRSFRADRFEAFLARVGIAWPRLESGRLDLKDDTFREMAKAHPIVSPLRELRHALSEMRLNKLQVGKDGRNRALLSPFQSKTGRNQPSNTRFIFGPSVWLRSLIKPAPGHALAYVDWAQQEFAIAAALSGDGAMMDAYSSGDPYLALAKQAQAVPPDATKATHGPTRELFKTCVLGVQYGMEENSLALRINRAPIEARALLRAHHEAFPQFWRWSDDNVHRAALCDRLETVFGWQIQDVRCSTNHGSTHRSLQNFKMQSNGAEMMRIAACLGTERGVEIVAPVHDAFLVYAPLDRIEEDTATMQRAMVEASRAVLRGFELRTDAKITRFPDRFTDERGVVMWDRVSRLMDALEEAEGGAAQDGRIGA